ncbi:MAG: TIR domain-containing protein, partial [Actinoplanes sp.]
MSDFGHTAAVTVLFVSYGRDHAELAASVRDGLVAAGYEDVYLDVDANHGMVAGQHWQAELWSQVQRADAVIFLSSRASNRSRWCFTEVTLAQLAGRPVLPVIVEDDDPGWLADTQHILFSLGLPEVVRRLTAALRRHGLGVERAGGWDRSRPPYPGLVPFTAADAAVFYGRDELIGRVAGHLELGGVALVGPSGSGKSSLLRAGVLPRMARQADRWVVLPPVTPPWLPPLPPPVDGRRVLVAVDQAEELVTRCTATERREFFQALRSATAAGRVRVVATIRSEFLPATPEMGELAGLTDAAVLVGPLTRDQLPEAIEGPARKAGLSFDPGLVARMAGDTVGGDALPLLGYLLNRLVERAPHRITVADYEAAGGVVGALRQQADMVTERLTGPVLPTLLKLVTIHEDGEPTARRISRRSLAAAENAVIDAFVEARLLVSSADGVAVAHEALLRQWPVLGEAIAEHRDELRVRSEVERAEREWELSGRRSSYLLRGERLARAANDGSAFLAASARHDRAERIRASESLANRAGMLVQDHAELAGLLALAAIEEHAPTAEATQVLGNALLQLAAPSVATLVLTDGGFLPEPEIAWSPDGA